MDPTIVFDLDYTLYNPVKKELHPDAHIVLRRARRDFGKVLLWTFGFNQEDITYSVSRIGIAHYFDGLIGDDHELSEASRLKRHEWGCKDLSLIAPEHRIVMIENDDFCVPKGRRVLVPTFDGKKSHDLRKPYHFAYLLMYHTKEFQAMSQKKREAAATELERGCEFTDKELQQVRPAQTL